MHGAYHLEEYGTLPGHTHSDRAFALLKSFKIGEIIGSKYNILQLRNASSLQGPIFKLV